MLPVKQINPTTREFIVEKFKNSLNNPIITRVSRNTKTVILFDAGDAESVVKSKLLTDPTLIRL
jgi:hypothetical protein